MQPVELMEGYVSKLKDAEKLLKSLERKAKALAKKQQEADETRIYSEAQITNHQRDIAALESELDDLKLEYMESSFSQDVQEQREIQNRRTEIDRELQEDQDSIRSLRSSLDNLEDFSKQGAEIASALDALNFGQGYYFANNLRDALQSNERALESRQSTARKQLPAFDQSIYREHRLENDEIYAKQQAGKELRDKQTRAKVAENERLSEAARNPKKAVTNDDGYVVGYR